MTLISIHTIFTDVFPQGCRAFRGISPNVEAEESGMRDDSGMQDVQYTEVMYLQPSSVYYVGMRDSMYRGTVSATQ